MSEATLERLAHKEIDDAWEATGEFEPHAVVTVTPAQAEGILGGAQRYVVHWSQLWGCSGHWWLVFASPPVDAVVGAFRCHRVHRLPAGDLRLLTRGSDGLSDLQFAELLNGLPGGAALEVCRPCRLPETSHGSCGGREYIHRWLRGADWFPPRFWATVHDRDWRERDVMRALLAACLSPGVWAE